MKKVLLIAPCFFNYYKRMIEELEGFGYSVDYVEDKPSSNTLFRAVARVNKDLVKPFVKPYFKKVLDKAGKEKYDIVLLVAGMSFAFDKNMISQLREQLPQSKFIMYQWDSVENLKYPLDIKEYFDSCYSFDSSDIKKYDFLQFLPLFYTRCYEDVANSSAKPENDCIYVGTAHKSKFAPVNIMAEKLRGVYPNQMIYHYMPSVFKFLYQKLLFSEFRHTKKSDFHYNKIKNEDLLNIMKSAKCVLDAPQAHQIGLTIRSIECLGAKKKLITTNQDIVNYDFYNPKNIYVYKGEFDFASPFFTEPYEEVEKSVYEKYALRNWLKTMIEPSVE